MAELVDEEECELVMVVKLGAGASGAPINSSSFGFTASIQIR